MGRRERQRELARRRTRQEKLKKLRTKYREATSEADKARIAAKVRTISPFVDLEQEEAAVAAS